jgi:DeoR/GlpR family transcriptional regulator of sugar metabolism
MRVPLHIVEARRERLRDLIRTGGFLPVAELSKRLGVSAVTVRRDLATVAARGHITRTRGGALADYNTTFASLGQRAQWARTAKERIARTALAQLPDKGVVFLDAGTTVQSLARQMLRRRTFTELTVVTNSLPVASILGGARGIELHMLGGIFLHRQAVLLGPHSVQALASWMFDAAFLGGEGMDADGVTNSHANLAAFQQAVLARANRTFFCIDETKLGRSTPHRVTGWVKNVSLVTDARPATLAASGVVLPAKQLLAARY